MACVCACVCWYLKSFILPNAWFPFGFNQILNLNSSEYFCNVHPKHTPPAILTNKSRSKPEIYLTTLSIAHSPSLRRQSRRMSHLKLCTRCCATNFREDSKNPFIHLFSRSQTTKRFREIWSEENEFLTIQPWQTACQNFFVVLTKTSLSKETL